MSLTEKDLSKFFRKSDGTIWQFIAYCPEPTGTLEKVGTIERVRGSVASSNLQGLTPLTEDETEVLRQVVSQCARESS